MAVNESEPKPVGKSVDLPRVRTYAAPTILCPAYNTLIEFTGGTEQCITVWIRAQKGQNCHAISINIICTPSGQAASSTTATRYTLDPTDLGLWSATNVKVYLAQPADPMIPGAETSHSFTLQIVWNPGEDAEEVEFPAHFKTQHTMAGGGNPCSNKPNEDPVMPPPTPPG